MSHELHSPLFVVMGYAQLIAAGTFGAVEADVENAVHKIHKQGTRLSTMIANLLDLSQLDSGQLALALWPFDRREVLDQMAESLPALIEDKPILFERDYDHEFPLIVSHREKLKQILGHLLDTAEKFTESGTISLRACARDGGIEIAVKDTAIGIDAAHQEIIFDGFRQVDAKTTGATTA